MALIMDIIPPTEVQPKRRLLRLLLVIGGILVVVGLAGTAYLLRNDTSSPAKPKASSPVPAHIRKATGFQVYYPDQQKLPAGYTLDTASFKMVQAGVVVFSVVHQGAQLQFSEEKQPSQDVIDKFLSDYIPVHVAQSTELGKAEFGAINNRKSLQSVVSLPINNGPWLIITAPGKTTQGDLLKIIQSLSK